MVGRSFDSHLPSCLPLVEAGDLFADVLRDELGLICRCTGYYQIMKAIELAAERLAEKGGRG